MTLEKTYQAVDIEKKWYSQWEQAGYFKPSPSDTHYCIVLPPPNVTGTLHMGHAFQDTLMDALIRYHRMLGKQTLWQGGTDHAGIATQMVVERQLGAHNITKESLGRTAFIDKIWDWKAESGNIISAQMRRLGASIDWSRERFTLDDGLSAAVTEVFVQLYDEGLIYRGKRLVNWDPVLKTAVSDLEVNSIEEDGFLWYLRYPIDKSDRVLIVATTRPETMLGDTAVAVHPADPRYQDLINQHIRLPLTDRLIPIIADEYVDPEFGTGCVKITPAHDFNDHEIGKRHNLPMINILHPDATLNTEVPVPYQNLDRSTARKQVLADLDKLGLLEKTEPYRLKVPRAERSGAIVEPYLTHQWFVSTQPLAVDAIKAVKNGDIKFVPENWENTYFDWMENIQDWCISRQLWWGHRIPAWYDEQETFYVAPTEEEARAKYHLDPSVTLTQDEDVLDTWFSAALWPFSSLGWPDKTQEQTDYYPTNVLVTGFDIIFFWVARMIMFGLKFKKAVPFKEVFVHGLILDPEGQKMSKSKGNIIDPLDIIDGIDLESLVQKRTSSLMQPKMAKQIEKDTRKHFPEGISAYGTDALRFTFCALASTGRQIRFDMARLEGYRNFCNKLWNASRFVFMNLADKSLGKDNTERSFSVFDQAMLSRWQGVKQVAQEHFAHYRFDLLAQALYDFTWNHYCDWYLELTKPVLTDPNASEQAQNGTRFTLAVILEELLRALHPLIPFITEEIWQKVTPILGEDYFKQGTKSIMTQPYPLYQADQVNPAAEAALEAIQGFIMGVRTIRGEMNLKPGQAVPVLCRSNNSITVSQITEYENNILALSKVTEITWLDQNTLPPMSATALYKDLEIFIPLAGLIDQTAELKRLNKEMEKLEKEITGCEQKLANPAFTDRAPADVVNAEKARLASAQQDLHKLQEQSKQIASL